MPKPTKETDQENKERMQRMVELLREAMQRRPER
jgi:hypothetical protein